MDLGGGGQYIITKIECPVPLMEGNGNRPDSENFRSKWPFPSKCWIVNDTLNVLPNIGVLGRTEKEGGHYL